MRQTRAVWVLLLAVCSTSSFCRRIKKSSPEVLSTSLTGAKSVKRPQEHSKESSRLPGVRFVAVPSKHATQKLSTKSLTEEVPTRSKVHDRMGLPSAAVASKWTARAALERLRWRASSLAETFHMHKLDNLSSVPIAAMLGMLLCALCCCIGERQLRDQDEHRTARRHKAVERQLRTRMSIQSHQAVDFKFPAQTGHEADADDDYDPGSSHGLKYLVEKGKGKVAQWMHLQRSPRTTKMQYGDQVQKAAAQVED